MAGRNLTYEQRELRKKIIEDRREAEASQESLEFAREYPSLEGFAATNVGRWRKANSKTFSKSEAELTAIRLELFETYPNLVGDNEALNAVASFRSRMSVRRREALFHRAREQDEQEMQEKQQAAHEEYESKLK